MFLKPHAIQPHSRPSQQAHKELSREGLPVHTPIYSPFSALYYQHALGWCQENRQSSHTPICNVSCLSSIHCLLIPQSQNVHFNKGASRELMVQVP